MAIVEVPAVSVVYGMRDIENTETSMRIHTANPIEGGLISADFIIYLQFQYTTMRNAIQALTDSPVVYFGVTFNAVEDAPPPFGTGEAESKGVFRFTNAAGRPSFAMAVPGIKTACLAANGRDIDLTNADVSAFVTAMTTGAQIPVDANGTALALVQGGDAYKQHRRSSGGSGRATG